MNRNKVLFSTLCILSICFCGSLLRAQAPGLFGKMNKNSKAPKGPTIITSDTMDIKNKENVAIFTGNVEVDDPKMNIKCHKMTIYLEDKKKAETDKTATDKNKTEAVKPLVKETAKDSKAKDAPVKVEKKAAEPKSEMEEAQASKGIREVVCIGDVVVVRKLYDENEKRSGEQKSTSGKAVYNLKQGTIVLTEDPIVYRGISQLKADKIILWVESEEVKAEGKVRIEYRSIDTAE
jgi:lipopolysaccharide export system protein LptA